MLYTMHAPYSKESARLNGLSKKISTHILLLAIGAIAIFERRQLLDC